MPTTIELPMTTEWTPELLERLPTVVYQHRLTRIPDADPRYAESRVVLLKVLEAESAA